MVTTVDVSDHSRSLVAYFFIVVVEARVDASCLNLVHFVCIASRLLPCLLQFSVELLNFLSGCSQVCSLFAIALVEL